MASAYNQNRIIVMFKLSWKTVCILSLFLAILASCDSKKHYHKTTKKKYEREVVTITLLISRGSGREVLIKKESDLQIDFPDSVSAVVYKCQILKNGLLKTSHGFGKLTVNTIELNQIDRLDSIMLSKAKTNHLFSLANKLYLEKEYLTTSSPTDSWICKLILDEKSFIYYRGDSNLDLDFLHIVDAIVRASTIKSREYPN